MKKNNKINSIEAATILDMSPDDINKMARKKIIKAKKINNRWVYDRKEIYKFKEKQRST